MTIHLGLRLPGGSSSAPGSSAGRLITEPVRLAPDGVWQPPCHHDAGGLLPHLFTLTAGVSGEETFAGGGLLSVPLSVGFRRLGFPQRPALWCPDFPRAARAARGHPACTSKCSAASPTFSSPEPHSGHATVPS